MLVLRHRDVVDAGVRQRQASANGWGDRPVA
jgi:hypothetical protein